MQCHQAVFWSRIALGQQRRYHTNAIITAIVYAKLAAIGTISESQTKTSLSSCHHMTVESCNVLHTISPKLNPGWRLHSVSSAGGWLHIQAPPHILWGSPKGPHACSSHPRSSSTKTEKVRCTSLILSALRWPLRMAVVSRPDADLRLLPGTPAAKGLCWVECRPSCQSAGALPTPAPRLRWRCWSPQRPCSRQCGQSTNACQENSLRGECFKHFVEQTFWNKHRTSFRCKSKGSSS